MFVGFDGFVLASDEGEHIARALGPTNRVIILQNHGILAVGKSADGAAYTFGAFERCVRAQFLAENMGKAKGIKPIKVSEEGARGVRAYYSDEFQYISQQPAYGTIMLVLIGRR